MDLANDASKSCSVETFSIVYPIDLNLYSNSENIKLLIPQIVSIIIK